MSSAQTQRRFMRSYIKDFLNQGQLIELSPEDLLIGWGEIEQRTDPLGGGISFYTPDFYLKSERPWLVPQYWDRISKNELHQHLLELETSERACLDWQEPSAREFQRRFHEIQNCFSHGELLKAVPVVFAQAEITTAPVARVLQKLLEVRDAVSVFGCWHDGQGILGATPETLFSQDALYLETMALAGTRPRSDRVQELEEFLLDPKERREHQLVVADLQEVLEEAGVVKTGTIEILKLSKLMHLCTRISVNLDRDIPFAELVRRLHPTPALGLAPRSLGLDYLRQWDEPARRLKFGAPFGVQIRSERKLALVAIRCLQWQDGVAYVGSGCGIVKESEVAREWAELQLKRESFFKMAGL